MTKYWCATVALMAVIASPALAQTTKTEKSVDGDGIATHHEETVAPSGDKTTSSAIEHSANKAAP
jgi:hypothetical protein